MPETQDDQPPRNKNRAVGSNHHSCFGVFELKQVLSKGRVTGLWAECKRHFCAGDSKDCARTLTFRDGSDNKEMEEVVRKLRMWLALGASVEEARLHLRSSLHL